ncbi:MAG: PIG-L family deacetylase [Prolixibacteraceae bacterium]|jgi:LmbE family N-acetylglucosaminyl deacetylase|nr:PIG-L family deacetylase [Prolixibacteraceae bacterium]
MEKRVLGIFSHPDDAEIMAAGTLSLLKKAGWMVHMATMTPGDKGSAELSREEISAIRRVEAANSAALLDATYHCLEFEDVYIAYDKDSINKTTALIRKVKPSLVLTASPTDYMVDHEITSRIVLTACFSAGMKNLEVSEPILEGVPTLYYSDPLDGKDLLGNPIQPTVYVDITGEMPIKEEMLGCHETQRSWLRSHHKMDEYILAMKRFSAKRGAEINVKYAEGFRQHLGHAFPQQNLLKEALGELVRNNEI